MASTLSAKRVVSVPFNGEIGEDLTVAFLSPIASMALARCSNDPFS